MKLTHTGTGKKRKHNAGTAVTATWKALFLRSFSSFPLILPNVHKLAGPVIMFRLKRMGYSNCRVMEQRGGLAIYADR